MRSKLTLTLAGLLGLAIVTCFLPLTTGCTLLGNKAECLVKDKVATGFTSAVVDNGVCPASGRECVQKRHEALLEGVGLCKQPQQTGPIGDVVCPIAVKTVVDKVASAGFNAVYPGCGCTGGVTVDAFKAFMTSKCVEYSPVAKEN